METTLYNRSDSSDNDRWIFLNDQRKTRLSSKYAPRYCCATLVTFKEQYPVTAHVPEDARRAREPWKIRLHRAWPSSILHQNFSELQINNILFPLSWAGIQKSARCVQILKIIYVRWDPPYDSDKLRQSLLLTAWKALYARLQSVESKQFLFRVFLSGNSKQLA